MNASVRRIVELVFQDVELTDEVRALREEVMNNCQERYEDQRAQGKDEDEAIDAVMESLRGMEEVLAAYPRAQTGAEAPEAPEEPEEPEESEEAEEETQAELRFDLEGVSLLRVNLCHEDVQLVAGEADVAVVRLMGGGMEARRQGDALVVCSRKDAAERGGLGWLSRMFGGPGGCEACVELPADAALRAFVGTESGDVSVQGLSLRELEVQTVSGDVNLTAGCTRARVKTGSGDINAAMNADEASFQTMSGDMRLEGTCDGIETMTVSGDIRLRGTFQHAALSSVSGDAALEADARIEKVFAKNVSGDVRIRLSGVRGVCARLKTLSGDARCRLPESGDAAVRVDAQTVSGDITVE